MAGGTASNLVGQSASHVSQHHSKRVLGLIPQLSLSINTTHKPLFASPPFTVKESKATWLLRRELGTPTRTGPQGRGLGGHPGLSLAEGLRVELAPGEGANWKGLGSFGPRASIVPAVVLEEREGQGHSAARWFERRGRRLWRRSGGGAGWGG